MSGRPKILHVGGTLYWVIRTRDPDTMVLKDADSTPTVAVRKNGASVGDSVTVTKRSATTGIYDCSYNPASEVEGDSFTIEESATVTGTTTAQATYTNSWELRVVAVERGTDGANTTTPPTANDIADQVWDETLTGVSHNNATSAGRRLRTLADTVILKEGDTVAADNDGSINGANNLGRIQLQPDVGTVCVGQAVRVAGQVRFIEAYDAGTQYATVDSSWCTIPSPGDEYSIFNLRTSLIQRISSAVVGTIAYPIAKLWEMLEDSTGWRFTAKALEEVPNEFTGNGPRTVSVTVTDGASPLSGAIISLNRGGVNRTATTGITGTVNFNLSDGDWQVALAAEGYYFSGDVLTVDGNETVTYAMTEVTIAASSPGKTTGYWTCFNENGIAEEGAAVMLSVVETNSTVLGSSYDSKVRTELSAANGVVQFTNLHKGVTYRVQRGSNGPTYLVTIPTTAGSSVALDSFIGLEDA